MATIINGDGIVTAEGTSSTQGRLRLGEDTDNGTNYVELQAPASVASNVTFTLPSADGTNGQVLQTNGSGALSFANATSLASPLAVVGNSTAGAEIRLPEDTDNGANYVALKAADNLASNLTFTLPSADGTSGQVLQTNASGTLSFANLAVANGGTGQTSLTANNIILGNGTSAVQFVAPGTSGNVLTSNGTTWTSGTTSVAGGGTGQTSLTANNVILGNGASAVQFVAPGTNGNVLTSNGTTWQSTAPSGGGAWTFITSVTASGASTVDVESSFDSTYDQYVIVAPAFTLSGSPTNTELKMRLKIGGSYPGSTGYMYAIDQTNSTTYSGLSSSNNDAIYLSNRLSDSASYPNAVMDLIIYISKPYTTNRNKSVMWQGTQTFQNNPNVMTGVGWYSGSTAALTGVRLLFAGGATFSGNFRLYGIKNS